MKAEGKINPKARGSYDLTDGAQSSYHVNKMSLVSFMASIILHCIDVAFDIYVSYSYFYGSKYSYGAWSVALIFLSSVVLASLSIGMYLKDSSEGKMKPSSVMWRVMLCILGLPIQSAPLIRSVETLYLAYKFLKSRNLEETYFKMLNEDADSCFLKVFEAYLESAPQQVLQMTLLIVEASQGLYVHSYRQIISIVVGFLSMSLCMATYYRSIRLDQDNKENIKFSGLIVYFLWHLLFTVCRILSISAVASLYPLWTCIAIGIHWFISFILLLLTSEHSLCISKFLDILLDASVGGVYIFNFLSLKDEKKRYYYLVYYFTIFVENVVATVIWGLKSSFENWVYYFFIILPPVSFILGLIFMILYYTCFHPNLTKTSVVLVSISNNNQSS